MKIGVYWGYIPENVGGGYTFQKELFKALIELADKSKHTFTLFAFSNHSQKLFSEVKNSKIKFQILKPPSFLKKVINYIFAQTSSFFLRRRKLDYFNKLAHLENIEMIWFLGNDIVSVDIPYITVVWDLQHRLQPYFPEVNINGVGERREKKFSWFLREATTIICGTNAGKKEVQTFYQIPAERIKVLPHPTPQFIYNNDEENIDIYSRFQIPKTYLFYPAQFWSHKNHANLLLALSELKNKYKHTPSLVLSGSDKGNKEYIQSLVKKLKLEKQVFFVGFVSENELIALYKNALAMVYLTFFGPENLPPLEAFALACPVIASNVSGSKEQLSDAAIRVNPCKPKEIAKAINSIIVDPNLKESLVKKGLDKAKEFTPRDYIKHIFKILDDFEEIRICWK